MELTAALIGHGAQIHNQTRQHRKEVFIFTRPLDVIVIKCAVHMQVSAELQICHKEPSNMNSKLQGSSKARPQLLGLVTSLLGRSHC